MSSQGGPPAAPTVAPARTMDRRYVTAALMLVMVLASMEATVTSTAMPTIIGELHGLEHYAWVASIYLLASTITMPLYGRLADTLGRKRVIVFAILLFAAGSVAAAASRSMLQLIIFRGGQGLGAGGIMPVVLTILGDIFTLKERARIQGFFSAVWGTASLAGPFLGAVFVKYLGWPSIFWVNLPAGFLGLGVLVWKYHDPHHTHGHPGEKPSASLAQLDLPGVVLLAIGSTALLAAFSVFSLKNLPVWVTPVLVVVAVASLIWFARVERRAANPVMPLKLLFNRSIGPAVLGSGLLGLGVFAIDTYVPLYVQGGLGGSIDRAASTITPVMLAWATSSMIAAPLVIRLGFRTIGTFGALLTLVGLVGLLLAAWLQWPFWLLISLLFLCGMGFGPASMAYLLGAQDAIDWRQRGVVTSSVAFFRTVGGALGVGLLGAIFNLIVAPGLAALPPGTTPAELLDPHALAKIPAEVLNPARAAIVHALLWVFCGMILAGLAQVLISLLITRHKAGHKPTVGEAMESISA